MPQSTNDIHISSAPTSNYTNLGFKTIREGFDPGNPRVGTETHEFTFSQDPWSVVSTSGATVVKLASNILTLSKIFNPNNTTDSFLVLSWIPEYFFKPKNVSQPEITVTLKDQNSAILGSYKLTALEQDCGKLPSQSRKKEIDSILFDRVATAAFTLGFSYWENCQ